MRCQTRKVGAAEPDAPTVRPFDPRQQIDEGGLARSVRADQPTDFARRYPEVDCIIGEEAAIALRQALGFEEGVHQASRPRSPNKPSGFTISTRITRTKP